MSEMDLEIVLSQRMESRYSVLREQAKRSRPKGKSCLLPRQRLSNADSQELQPISTIWVRRFTGDNGTKPPVRLDGSQGVISGNRAAQQAAAIEQRHELDKERRQQAIAAIRPEVLNILGRSYAEFYVDCRQ